MTSRGLLGIVPLIAGAIGACSEAPVAPAPRLSAQALHAGAPFTPLASSTQCSFGGDPAAPLTLPTGHTETVIASEPDYLDVPDMQTLNETGPFAGRFLYRTHELGSNAGVSVTDLWAGETHVLVRRSDWEALDGIVWTPWGTILFAEERTVASFPDPDFPSATAGLVYELDPETAHATPRPAIGSRAHEGMRFDPLGNLYGISESNPGSIFKFEPDRRGDLSAGQLYALKVVDDPGDGTGEAVWVPLDRAAVQINSNAEAARVGATGYFRPEDIELATSTGNSPGGAHTLYVAITGNGTVVRGRVLAVELRNDGTAFVSNYVKVGENAPDAFLMPDNLALDQTGRLFIAEDPGSAETTGQGDDIWVATPPTGPDRGQAADVVRFASLTDCAAEPTGLYFDVSSGTLFVDIQHRGGDGLDKTVAIRRQ
ncbi:MAG TPA: alkaline phosphatase PhoX [Gemmatimonadales bacterium]|jgi:secreted PhoX family phosphatase